MVLEVVLVVVLGGVEGLEGDDLRDDGLRINFCSVELRDISFGDFLLPLVRIENGRAVLRAVIRALAIELSGIVPDGKKDHENLAVGNLGWIEDDFHGFGVAGFAGADISVMGGLCRAAGIAGS